jgi:hypothetical protein
VHSRGRRGCAHIYIADDARVVAVHVNRPRRRRQVYLANCPTAVRHVQSANVLARRRPRSGSAETPRSARSARSCRSFSTRRPIGCSASPGLVIMHAGLFHRPSVHDHESRRPRPGRPQARQSARPRRRHQLSCPARKQPTRQRAPTRLTTDTAVQRASTDTEPPVVGCRNRQERCASTSDRARRCPDQLLSGWSQLRSLPGPPGLRVRNA